MKIPSLKVLFVLVALSFSAKPALAQNDLSPNTRSNNTNDSLVELADSNQKSAEALTSLGMTLETFLNAEQASLTEKGFRSTYEIGNLDPRLLDRTCMEPIDFSFTRELLAHSRTTLLAKCKQANPWKLFINVDFVVMAPRFVAATGIARGQLIQHSHLVMKEIQINKHQQTGYADPKHIVGMLAKRSIRPDRIITPDILTPPMLVERGDEVLITAKNSKIRIKMKGTALSKGRKGQQISVRNLQSNRVISAFVEDRGLVSVKL